MKLSKAQREVIRLKFDGRCAYCGHPLPAGWHVDHKEAIQRDMAIKDGRWVQTGKVGFPARHRMDNLMPACPLCNISKATLDIETWRRWLTGHLKSLNDRHSIYRLMKAYGVVVETGVPIIFYFETVQK